MRKLWAMIFVLSFFLMATACSSDSETSESNDQAETSSEEGAVAEQESSEFAGAPNESEKSASQNEDSEANLDEASRSDRKVIYNANLQIEVKDFQTTINDIQTQVAERNGYIVESHMSGSREDGSTSGQITARIPQGEFREFIDLVEEDSSKVLDSSVSGQDVTEEFVDLESRMESKKVVEERLLSFMEQAEKTEDLLKISNDLATVQDEIEEVQGRMNYLENKTELATVTISIQENNVRIAGEDLNTWEQTKQQFLKSINFIISTFSGLFVFFVGNLPVLVPLAVICGIVFWIIRRKKKTQLDQE
ncbi:DUF4349 domain-containing protein [Halobacillus seohaensis]|uniref:DUF4349 domain-containing protein n=1 Tax=Halobacillus seohaensis TaxID=447421 RepID=A0ABW2EQ67_9BACI